MQTNLFSDAFPLQERALAALHEFEFSKALDLLGQAQELNPEIPNNVFYEQIATFCLKNHLHENAHSQAIAEVWEMQHQEQAFDGHSTPVKKFLFKLFAQRLLAIDAFDTTGAIPDASFYLHISACYLHTEQYEKARKALASLLSGDVSSLPARYWGYYGDAAMHAHKAREANLGYLRLLAANPFNVDWSTFHHPGLQRLFSKLHLENDVQQAYGSWPFYAWSEGLIEIPKSNRYMSNILRSNLKGLNAELKLTPFERLHRFSLYVFYEQSGYDKLPDGDIRMVMKKLDEKRFREYLSICEKGGV
jgi:tetratricopeptide (TPR) repeat protein